MGKHRVIAETGAGQHGVATATVCALLGFECVVYMGTEDMRRQELNVFRMRLLGAEVRGVDSGSRTLKDAINEAMRDWVTNVRTTHYLLGSVLGAHPYPTMVRDFHKVIGREARAQILRAEGKLPKAIIACVGGGSNSIGIFHEFIKDKKVQLIGVEAGGRGQQLGEHAARFSGGSPGVLQGTYSYVLQDEAGQIATPIRFQPAWIILRSVPSTPGSKIRAARNTSQRRMRKRSKPALCWREPKASFPRWNRPTPWPRSSSARRR